jgi:hypothetical protein
MGQRTLAFTKQMLGVFNPVELEEPEHLVPNAGPSIPRSSGSQSIRNAQRIQTGTTKQIYIYIYMHKNITPFK